MTTDDPLDMGDRHKFGPGDIEEGDEVRFEYGERNHTSRKEVAEVLEWGVRVDGGGIVSYRDIIDVLEDEEADP